MLEHREPEFRAREPERDMLWNRLRACWNGEGEKALNIVGSDGRGRESLVRWVGRRAHEVGAAHILVFGEDAEYSVVHQLKTWFEQVGEMPGATSFYAVTGYDELAEWDLEQIQRIARGEELSGRTLSAVHARWTRRLSVDRLVYYHDPHGQALSLFRSASTLAPARRLLIAVGARGDDSYDESLVLRPLPDEVVSEIVSDLIGLSPRSLQRLCRVAGGNPGVAVDLARLAVREDCLEPTGAGLELGEEQLDALVERVEHRWPHVVSELAATAARCVRLLAHADLRAEFVELEAIAAELNISAGSIVGALQECGLLLVDDQGIHFSHPLARRAAAESAELTVEDHEQLARAFGRPLATPRRRRIAAFHAFCAGMIEGSEVLEHARELRSSGHVEAAVILLRDFLDLGLDGALEAEACLELAECYLIRQEYHEANELLARFGDEAPESVKALELFLALRRLEELPASDLFEIDASLLTSTACRMFSYMLMDFGEFEKAREVLENMKSSEDPGGLFALARLEFLQGNGRQAEEFATRAVSRFFETGRPDGAVAARDLVASARLKLGRHESAALIYRQNLKTARQIGFPTIVMEYNLATLLLETDLITDEIDDLLESALRQAMQRGRKDIEHCARAAQVNYAFAIENDTLARHRIERLVDFDLGPWLQSDSLDHLEQALERAPRHLADELEPLVRHVAKALHDERNNPT